MNIKKFYRLNNKEIRYIIKTNKKKFLRGKILNINIISQFYGKNYNKFGISISSKFHKKAVYRNIVRRIFFDIIYKNNYIYKNVDGNYIKMYVTLKKGVEYDFENDLIKKEIKKNIETDLRKIFGN